MLLAELLLSTYDISLDVIFVISFVTCQSIEILFTFNSFLSFLLNYFNSSYFLGYLLITSHIIFNGMEL